MKLPPLIDLHEDISYYYVNSAAGLGFPVADFEMDLRGRHGDIPKFRRAHVSIVFSSIFCLIQTLATAVNTQLAKGYGTSRYDRAYAIRGAAATAMEHIKVYYSLQKRYGESIHIIRKGRDIDTAVDLMSIGFLMAMEGAYPIEDIYDLSLYYNMGLRCLGLAWNFDSRYCASCMSKKDYGLTGEGEDLIRECNRLGVIVDLAHASRQTHFDVVRTSKLPVINSHSSTKALHAMSRNLDDDMYEAVKKNRGVVGMIFSETMIGMSKTIEDLATHLMRIYENFGPDVLAIGTDYFGLVDYPAVKGLEDITKVRKLYEILEKKGMSEADIEKLAYKNALRVIKENAKHWD
jgi:membrane dipeptidase